MDANFLPTTAEEMHQRKWNALDVIIVSGDSYIDSPFIGAAVIGRVLEQAGFGVGIIAQPRLNAPDDITRLGEPRLFWGVSGGSVDSMVANYTASKKKRKSDDYTPGGINNRRPDRALIVYSNLIRRYFKDTCPIVLGGIEASLRRVAHYDFWSDRLRRSILFDAKADFLLYGMAETSVLKLARAIQSGANPAEIKGLCYIDREPPQAGIELPSYETVDRDKTAFMDMFDIFYQQNDPITAKGIFQRHGERYLVQNPPSPTPTMKELDAVFDLPYQRAQHPYYEGQGKVKALETIRFAINTHRGCYGECNFCAIAIHEGRTVHWRSENSILAEAERLTHLPGFKGYIMDVGGPTANMYGYECHKKLTSGGCSEIKCIYPVICRSLKPDHQPLIRLLDALRSIPGIKKVFVASGMRYDLVLADEKNQQAYLKQIVRHHVSGQLKLAPEHSEPNVLAKMGKPPIDDLLAFKQSFDDLSRKEKKPQFLTYYFIAAHPGCTEADMQRLKAFASRKLHISPEQVQIFTPTPSTYSSLMYYTGIDPFTREPVFVEKEPSGRVRQKEILSQKEPNRRQKKGSSKRSNKPMQ